MEKLKSMKDNLVSMIQTQMGNLHSVDAKELGEVIDMVKDLSEAIYYCTITEAMEEKEEKGKEYHHYYTEKIYRDNMMMDRDMDRYNAGRMYYPMYYGGDSMTYASGGSGGGGGRGGSSGGGNSGGGGGGNSGGGGSSRNFSEYMIPYTEMDFPMEARDRREGRSPMRRRMYMESKEMHHDKGLQIKELNEYMQELSQDLVEMINGASPEEKQLLQKKLTELGTKIEQTH